MDWIGNFLICFGLWHIGNKKRWAWFFSMTGESTWTIYAISIHLYSLAIICAVFAGLAVRSYIQWGKETKP